MTVSKQEKLACARRELALRREVYPKLIARGKMRRPTAEHEIRVMQAIVADYEDETDLFSNTPDPAGWPNLPEDDWAAGRPPHSKRGSR